MKEGLVGRLRWSVADFSSSSSQELVTPGRESYDIWLNPGQESHMVWLYTGVVGVVCAVVIWSRPVT